MHSTFWNKIFHSSKTNHIKTSSIFNYNYRVFDQWENYMYKIWEQNAKQNLCDQKYENALKKIALNYTMILQIIQSTIKNE